ncbi:MAG: lipid II flippase MurJ, partial [Erythrobacter sp.]|nr:lipid II flippase MurJ [Erythrobacter sp.]
AAVALAVCAEAFVTMIFQGGRFDLADAAATGQVLAALVLGLPAYVLVKVLVPNFYARADTRTPVVAAFISLGVFIVFSIALLEGYGVIGVAFASVIGAWINVAFLLVVLAMRGHYRVPVALLARIARQALAAGAMGAALFYTTDLLTGWYSAGLLARLGALLALIGAAAIVYFGIAFAVGAIDRQRIATLTKRAK